MFHNVCNYAVVAIIAILSLPLLSGCAISANVGLEPHYEKAVIHTVLVSGEDFNPIKIARETGSRLTVIDSQNDLTKFAFNNTIYCIKSEINLQGKTLEIPSGCLLFFNGGSFRNGIVKGSNTVVVAENYEIFKHGITTYRAYKADTYKYISKKQDDIVIEGTWNNSTCGSLWTGMTEQTYDHCVSQAINNFINLHKKGQQILFPANKEYYVYNRIICSGYSIDFNNSIIKSIDFANVENKSISLPRGTQPRPLKSLYGLLEFNGDNAYIKNLTIDGRARHRAEEPSLGTECLISMASNNNCLLENVKIVDAVGCGICTYTISDCSFENVSFNGCGEHGIYTHAYKGSLKFNNCAFVNCGQNATLFKQRGASACVKFSGARDRKYADLRDLKAYFSDCLFESNNEKLHVATLYSDIPYAEFVRCSWRSVLGYSIVSPVLAEQIGRLVEFKFVECENPCCRIQSANTIRRLIRCTKVTHPFEDSIELTDCEILVGYSDVENTYSALFNVQYNTPVICTNCKFIKGAEDTPIRNTIKNPRPMVFEHCSWDFSPSIADRFKGSYFLVLDDSNNRGTNKAVSFTSCEIDIDKYRLLYCSDTDVIFKDCKYQSSYDTLVDGLSANHPNRVQIFNMTNTKKLIVTRN